MYNLLEILAFGGIIISYLITTLLNIKEMCKTSKTKLAKEILEQIKID